VRQKQENILGNSKYIIGVISLLIALLPIIVECGSGDTKMSDNTARTGLSDHGSSDGNGAWRNRLANEKSPYLLQHANNPVNWYPWGEEAFEKARSEDKPIFLSIGYSTCHWCHVMEHESFEDLLVAELMNDAFVCIKVDREERPDIDNVYMTVCQMMTHGGGWPLTIIMTPDKKPFFAGTYIPKENRFGRTGMIELIPQIKNAWIERRADILASAEQITSALQQTGNSVASGSNIGEITLTTAFDQLKGRFDSKLGGFTGQRKFPIPHNYMFLLRYWNRSGDEKGLEIVEKSLKSMRYGGIYDHVGFGFHRYSTDPNWFLPHFEKMLYDQALLAMAYIEAYQVTGDEFYAQTAREVFTYVIRDMTSPDGGFYSAEDADSEGEEGKFYLWTDDELTNLLGEQDAKLARRIFNVETRGNYREEASGHDTGANILHMTQSLPELASALNMTLDQFDKKIDDIRAKLFDYRERRIHPYKDDKILTDWNGLMIAALARGAQALGDDEYRKAAENAADFMLARMRTDDGRLLHRFRDGEAIIPAYIDDYAFLTWGLLELYEATFSVDYLKVAIELNDTAIEHFWDGSAGGFFFTADDSEDLIHRSKEIYDGAVPSGNAVAMLNLIRLGRMTGNPSLEQRASELSNAFSGTIAQSPSNHTLFMMALDFAVGPSYEVVIVGNPETSENLLGRLRTEFIPNKVVIMRPDGEESPEITKIAAYTKSQTSMDGKPTVYVYLNFNCKLPTTDPNEMLAQLREKLP
jgi:uncharacterized protein YyaL (SSP411 family)